MKREKAFKIAFGTNEWDMIDFPEKISNVAISRIVHGIAMGCEWCFPHGYETINSTIVNRQKSWKKFRKTRWKRK